jgi:hypothetical protein
MPEPLAHAARPDLLARNSLTRAPTAAEAAALAGSCIVGGHPSSGGGSGIGGSDGCGFGKNLTASGRSCLWVHRLRAQRTHQLAVPSFVLPHLQIQIISTCLHRQRAGGTSSLLRR